MMAELGLLVDVAAGTALLEVEDEQKQAAAEMTAVPGLLAAAAAETALSSVVEDEQKAAAAAQMAIRAAESGLPAAVAAGTALEV